MIEKAAKGRAKNASIAEMRAALGRRKSSKVNNDVGVNEAVRSGGKKFSPPDVGGVALSNGMPIGGVDMNKLKAGQQLMPQAKTMQPPGADQPMTGDGQPPAPPMGNMLQMTQQGQALDALDETQGPQLEQPAQPAQPLAKGGKVAKKVYTHRVIGLETGKVLGRFTSIKDAKEAVDKIGGSHCKCEKIPADGVKSGPVKSVDTMRLSLIMKKKAK
jgi:hypothetical protein